jgi:hypothetical protein
MSTVNNGPQIVRSGLVLNLDAGNGKSYSTNRFQSLGSGTVTENVTFAINGTGTFQRVASGTVVGGYTVRPNDVVYSYALGVTGCHYHGNTAPIPSGVYATFSVDYLITNATNIATSYPNNVVLVYENYGGSALAGSTSLANNYQNIWQRLTLINGPTAGVGTQAMFLYPGFCSPGKLADSGTIYFRNPKVEWTNVDTGNSTFNSTSNIGLWYDLSGNGYNGTLTNGPTSNFSNKGSIAFDGSDEYSTFTPTPTILQGNPNLTVMGFYRRTASFSGKGFWGIGGSNAGGTGQGICNWNSGNTNEITIDTWSESTFTTGQTYPLNTWVGVAWRKIAGPMTRANCIISIFNGTSMTNYTSTALTVLRAESSVNPVINSMGGITLGSISVDTGYCAPVNIASHCIYNRILTDAEISQNFQAMKTRFGL